MTRNKYINTFNTTTEYDNYIESAAPEFPNVALTKDDGEIHYRTQSPNDYQIWGTTTATSSFGIKLDGYYGQKTNVNVDTELGEFYLSGLSTAQLYGTFDGCTEVTSVKKIDLTPSSQKMSSMFYGCTNVVTVNLSGLNTSNINDIQSMFYFCSSMTTLYLNGCDFSNVTAQNNAFNICSSLTDVYIDVEATLNKLTNNLSSQGNNYIPSNNGNCAIHYDNGTGNVDYKWQNNAWTPQS